MDAHCMDDFRDVFEKYGASPEAFEKFLTIEADEDGDRGIIKASEDIRNIQSAVLNEAELVSGSNDILNHPFLTTYQVAVVSEYLEGDLMVEVLTNKTEKETFEAIRTKCDGLLACALMAYDEKFSDPDKGNRVIAAMLARSDEKIHELQVEMERESSPSMRM